MKYTLALVILLISVAVFLVGAYPLLGVSALALAWVFSAVSPYV